MCAQMLMESTVFKLDDQQATHSAALFMARILDSSAFRCAGVHGAHVAALAKSFVGQPVPTKIAQNGAAEKTGEAWAAP